MDLTQIGVQLLQSKLGSNLQTSDIASAFSGLFGGKNLDIASLMAKMQGSGGLAYMLPQLIDKASSGGSLLESAKGSMGGTGGLMGMAGKLFGK